MAWIELIENPEEAFRVLGGFDTRSGTILRHRLDLAHYFDLAFVFIYTCFNTCIFWELSERHRSRGNRFLSSQIFLGVGAIAALSMGTGDLVETVQLLRITVFATPEGCVPLLVDFRRILPSLRVELDSGQPITASVSDCTEPGAAASSSEFEDSTPRFSMGSG